MRGSVAFWTAAVPVACAVHCLATPLLLVVAPMLAPGPVVERWCLVFTAVVAVAVVLAGVRRHGHRGVWLPVVAGLGLWAASLAGWFGSIPEASTSAVGSLSVAGALVWNARLRAVCAVDPCACPVCPGPGVR